MPTTVVQLLAHTDATNQIVENNFRIRIYLCQRYRLDKEEPNCNKKETSENLKEAVTTKTLTNGMTKKSLTANTVHFYLNYYCKHIKAKTPGHSY
jgi:hypothetical protein